MYYKYTFICIHLQYLDASLIKLFHSSGNYDMNLNLVCVVLVYDWVIKCIAQRLLFLSSGDLKIKVDANEIDGVKNICQGSVTSL